MAFPTILVDSATGSDTAASGAGPATALTGSAGVTSADGLQVTLDGSPDLTNVATDGSHVIFMSDTAAGARNFGRIIAKANSGGPSANVTVDVAFGTLNTAAWAIGGKRASIGSTTSKKLLDNNGAAGDALGGWTIELASGHSETIAATYALRSVGSEADGPVVLRGVAGAATLPLLTFSNNGTALNAVGSFLQVRDLELRNSNATKTASTGATGNGTNVTFRGLKVAHSTDKFWKGLVASSTGGLVRDCEAGYCASSCVEVTSSAVIVVNCWVHDGGADGILVTGNLTNIKLFFNAIYGCVGDGINYASTANSVNPSMIVGNVCTGNTSDGVRFTSSASQLQAYANTLFANNELSNNGGFGVRMGASVTDISLRARSFCLLNNNHYNNTGDTARLTNLGVTAAVEENTTNINPAYVGASTGDFTSKALYAKGYPLGGTLKVGTYSSTYSYPDIGLQAALSVGAPLVGRGLAGG